jgi:hypothetical protein
MRYIIWGWAAVFDTDGREVHDRAILQQLAGFVDAEDLHATDYIGGTSEEDEIVSALERSGLLRFVLRDRETSLRVQFTFVARRWLTTTEVDWLRVYTLGQWSDGMGECVFVPSGPLEGYKLQPLSQHEVAEPSYPFVTVIEQDAAPGTSLGDGTS